jgi:hypothetical protein
MVSPPRSNDLGSVQDEPGVVRSRWFVHLVLLGFGRHRRNAGKPSTDPSSVDTDGQGTLILDELREAGHFKDPTGNRKLSGGFGPPDQTKPKIPGTVPTNRCATTPNDFGPVSTCCDDDPKASKQ